MKKGIHKFIPLVAVALLLSGCATVAQKVGPVARTIADAQCSLTPEQRFYERLAYYNLTGRLLVGFCPGEPGYDDAVDEYITEPSKYKAAYYEAIVSGDPAALIEAGINIGLKFGKIHSDEDGCVVFADGGRYCPAFIDE